MASRRRPPPGRSRRLDASFQPLRTLTQIFVLQSIFYLAAFALILFTAIVAGQPFSPDLVFSWKSIRGDTTVGWTLGVVWIVVAGVVVIAQTIIIARSKLVLDFTGTLHFLHFIVVSLWEHELPRSFLWWGLQGVSIVGMGVLATWTCRWRELRPMTFGIGDYEMVDRGGRRVGQERVANGGEEAGAPTAPLVKDIVGEGDIRRDGGV